MSAPSSAVAAFGLLVFGLNSDRKVGLRGASMGLLSHPVGMTMLLFSGELVVGTNPVQYTFGICPKKHFVWRLFDHWLRLLKSDK